TVISATGGGSGSGSSGYVVADRQGATAGQNHVFSISPKNKFNLAAYALKEEAGTANQTYIVDEFNASSEPNYDTTHDVIFDGQLMPFVGNTYSLSDEEGLYSSHIKSDGRFIDISLITDTIVPAMTSNLTPIGYVASASNFVSSNAVYSPFVPFDGKSNTGALPDCWSTDGAWVPSISNPHWLRIDLPQKIAIDRYQIINRAQREIGNPNSWKLQGSDDGTTWVDLHQVVNDTNNTIGEIRDFDIGYIVNYKSYRILVTAKNGSFPYLTISKFKLFSTRGKFIINMGGKNYGVKNNTLAEVVGELTAEKINQYGTSDTGIINTTGVIFSKPVKLISDRAIKVRTRYTPHTQVAILKLLTPTAVWSKINSATLTATQTGNGKVRVAVTRDLVNWHVLRNGVWVDVGALSVDTAGATALIADGMTPTELGSITAAQWTQLFASNNGVPDSLAFAFALDITDPVADVATIDRLALNVNDASSWKVQSPAEVEIRWRTDSVTFRTATAGNYKLAYQVP
ncbi:discoidin domain-containing protein, partial [Pectobacterium punjabense]|uniref:discoidin domain-containing protein n=1 Tax=Pectobacterium punjabense TaxID=2108399 RepID=UPI0038149DB1